MPRRRSKKDDENILELLIIPWTNKYASLGVIIFSLIMLIVMPSQLTMAKAGAIDIGVVIAPYYKLLRFFLIACSISSSMALLWHIFKEYKRNQLL